MGSMGRALWLLKLHDELVAGRPFHLEEGLVMGVVRLAQEIGLGDFLEAGSLDLRNQRAFLDPMRRAAILLIER